MGIQSVIVVLVVAVVASCIGNVVIDVMASEAKNVATVKKLLDGFAKGDLQPIIDALASKYEWQVVSDAQVSPFFARYDNNINAYFDVFGSNFNASGFTVSSITSNSNEVIAMCSSTYAGKATGKKTGETVSTNWITFDNKGKIIKYYIYVDTGLYIDLLTQGQTPYSLLDLSTKSVAKFNARNPDLAFSDYSPDGVYTSGGEVLSYAEYKAGYVEVIASFPDIWETLSLLVADNNRVVQKITYTGTFTGAPYGGVQANGKPIKFTATYIQTVINGWIVAEDEEIDSLTLYNQIHAT